MNFALIIFFGALVNSEEIICREFNEYQQVCYQFDYTHPSCGPLLQSCPTVAESYDTLCLYLVCQVMKWVLG